MFRPLARLTNKTGTTVAILCEEEPTGEALDLPALPVADLKMLLARSQGNPTRSMRLDAGIGQKELASALGISQPMVSKLERTSTPLSKAMAAKVSAAVEAILESRRRWSEKPPRTYDDLLEIQAPILQLAAGRKPRSPVERRLLLEAGDGNARFETENRAKAPGQRALPPRNAK